MPNSASSFCTRWLIDGCASASNLAAFVKLPVSAMARNVSSSAGSSEMRPLPNPGNVCRDKGMLVGHQGPEQRLAPLNRHLHVQQRRVLLRTIDIGVTDITSHSEAPGWSP